MPDDFASHAGTAFEVGGEQVLDAIAQQSLVPVKHFAAPQLPPHDLELLRLQFHRKPRQAADDLRPIRVDVGLPLNRREGDPPFGVYVSLGQSF